MPPNEPFRRWSLTAALLITIVGAILRVLPLSESLWLDELHTAWCALGPLSEVADRAAIGNQSPLYFWFQWLSITFLGASEFVLRLPSFVAGTLLPLASFLLARRWLSEIAGLVAAGLIAIDPHCIFYATEARPYALVQLLAVAHLGLTLQVAEAPALAWRAGWVATAAILFHFHYTAALLIAAEAVFFVLVFLRQPNRLVQPLIDLVVVALLCLPAITNLQAIFARRANWAEFIPRQPLWRAIDWTPIPGWWWVVLFVVAGVGFARILKNKASTPRSPLVPPVRLLVCTAVIPVAVAWLATWTDVARLFFPRYLVVTFSAAALVTGMCIWAARFFWQRLALGLLTICVSLWSSGTAHRLVREGRPIAARGEDWRGCIAWLNEQLPNNGYPVLIWSGLIESSTLSQPHDDRLSKYCKLPLTSLYELDMEPSEIFPLSMRETDRLNPIAESLIVHRGGAWLVVRGERKTSDDIGSALRNRFQSSAAPGSGISFGIQPHRSFGRVHVLSIKSSDHP